MAAPKQSGVDGTITVKYLDNIAIVELNRGENRLNIDFLTKFHKALDEVERNASVKALITTGVGKFYSNGIDLNWLGPAAKNDIETAREFRRLSSGLQKRLLTFPMPTVAALNGHTFAAGAFIALSHDYRVMRSDRGWFSINEVHLGIPLGLMTRDLIRHKVPSSHFTDVVIMGKRLVGTEAKEAGIVQEVTSQNNLIPAAVKIINGCLPKQGILRENMATMKTNMWEKILESFDKEQTELPGPLKGGAAKL